MHDRAKAFVETRHHHDVEVAEDYVEIIADLITFHGKARVCDLASQLGVSHVTVIRTLERLQKKGYLTLDPIQLTDYGRKLAEFSKKRHKLLLDYLMLLGVPQDIASVDVEGMEHHVSQTTLEFLERHLRTLL